MKNLTLGKVKTRLAATTGDQKALDIYRYLLNYTYTVAGDVEASKYVFYADHVEEKPAHSYHRRLQQGGDLGERMQKAFGEILAEGFEEVIVIGSDTLEIDGDILKEAFDILDRCDVVLGPATDGGYYLLGMKKLHTELFDAIPWSTSEVFGMTYGRTRQSGLRCGVLRTLSDIDDERDWQMYASTVEL